MSSRPTVLRLCIPMKIKNLAKIEMSELDMLCTTFQTEVEECVSKIRDRKFTFYMLPVNERYRLLRLRVWTELYQVDLLYILSKLLPFWSNWIPKKSKYVKKGDGLGVRIATLTGKKSEQMLVEFIKQDFPSETHKLLHRNHLQYVVLNQPEKSGDGIQTASDKSKTLFDFPNPKGYLQNYRRTIRRQRDKREEMTQE